jgi:hypothetical protein
MRRLGRELADEVRGEDRGNGRGDAQPHSARLPFGDPAGGAGEQRRAQLALQTPDQLTQRRGGHVQALGSPAE